ncbi:MAG: lipopolysaccharide biosynthesis protein RfbH, partial [Lachnospiraceae bacterium]|nr:lipopolysaccharide biosynthesis protein RfbH [Lachnospiraceae bacterium]
MHEDDNQEKLRKAILAQVKEYCETYHNQKKDYQEGERIPYASRVYDSKEMCNLVDSAL